MNSIYESFYNNLIAEERYRMILDFMVENMKATPLSEEQRSQMAAQCLEVVEEPTERGFRVKLII
jgi:hypothetical protein